MNHDEIMLRLIMGNIGDEIALKNICEVHYMDIEEVTKKERDFLIHTNNFYYNVEEFCEIHEADKEEFQQLLEQGVLIKTTDGYVWKNCA